MIIYESDEKRYPILKESNRLLLNDLCITENLKFSKSWEICEINEYPELPQDFLERCISFFTTTEYKVLKCEKKHVHTKRCITIKNIPAYVFIPFLNSLNLLKVCAKLNRKVICIESDDKKLLNLRRKFHKFHFILRGDPKDIFKTLKENRIEKIEGLIQYALIILDSDLIDKIDDVLVSIKQIYQILMNGSYLSIIVPCYNKEINGKKIRLSWWIDKNIKEKTHFIAKDEKLLLTKGVKFDYFYLLNYLKEGKRMIEPFFYSLRRFA